MISTKEKIFACRRDLAKWQIENCCKCKKAIDANRSALYRCALQRDIERQQDDRRFPVNVRSIKMIKGVSVCPMLREKEPVQRNVGGVVKGSENKVKQPQTANVVRYVVRDGVNECEVSADDYAAAEKKVLDAIWDKKVKHTIIDPYSRFHVNPRLNDDLIKILANHDAEALLRTFSWDECMQIAFVPLVISKIAWIYAERAMKQCADMKISKYIKLCREIKALRNNYLDFISLDINRAQLGKVEEQAERLIKICEYDFTILWFQISQYIKTNAYGIPYENMRTNALMAIIIITFLKEHDDEMNDLVASKLAMSKSVTNPQMLKLSELLKGFLPQGFAYSTNAHINLCSKIFHNNLKKIVFEQDNKTYNIK